MSKKNLPLAALVFVLTMTLGLIAVADAWTNGEVRAARLCISEASGARTPDCRPIVWITMQRAARRHVTLEQYIEQHHTRHMRSPSRPWIAELDASMAQPVGWPASVSWDNMGRPGWEATLSLTRRVTSGEISHGCQEAPLDWGGRRVDCENLQARLRGDWHEVQCGGTVNMMLARGHREPVQELHCEQYRPGYVAAPAPPEVVATQESP